MNSDDEVSDDDSNEDELESASDEERLEVEKFKGLHISFNCDGWTDVNGLQYLTVTGHAITLIYI